MREERLRSKTAHQKAMLRKPKAKCDPILTSSSSIGKIISPACKQQNRRKSFFTLNVIIESAILVTVLMQQAECINISKILKLNETVHAITGKTK